MGKEAFDQGLLAYFETWKYKHPNPNDCIRVFEKISGLELDWYKEYWVYSTHTVDYGVKEISGLDGKISVTLEKVGKMPMPIDLAVTKKDGSIEYFNIPLRIMRGAKQDGRLGEQIKVLEDWPWVENTYSIELDIYPSEVQSVEIDNSYRMMDF